ncbi:MAG: hypothetical protein H6935_01250 [Thiobacillus sp.]|nr:hypothetical protein [Thiobacillus sp.]
MRIKGTLPSAPLGAAPKKIAQTHLTGGYTPAPTHQEQSMTTTVTQQAPQPIKRKRTRRNGIRKHGAGYQARVSVNKVTETRTFPTRKEAELWAQLKRGELLTDVGGGYHGKANAHCTAPGHEIQQART